MAHVYITPPTIYPPWPSPLPAVVPAPPDRPFAIPQTLFHAALRWQVPCLFASTYVLAVAAANAYNRSHSHRPWSISQSKAFQYFVVVHNVLLALYSATTFLAMWRAVARTLPSPGDGGSPAAWVDALCKLHGPRGLGDAVTFNTTLQIWESKNPLIHLTPAGLPDPTDVGRLWNEGLAFWGWLFYISKFYEVLDTFVILAKGKRSATLQTYHHAGAMICMWAGIRYMSPPIWMFVFINSAIHAMMYTYFALTALNRPVPSSVKRTLTSLQIAQFLFGASYAAAHLFIRYDIPLNTPYQVATVVREALSTASSAASSLSAAVATPSSVAWGPLVKKLLLRAAGEEGVAERVPTPFADHLGGTAAAAAPKFEEKLQQFNERTHYETRWRREWSRVNCIDTSGEAFAIYLNLLYLAPLTFLFGRFFVKAYLQRGKPRTVAGVRDSGRQARVETTEAVERQGKKVEGELVEGVREAEVKAREIREQLRKDVRKVRERGFDGMNMAGEKTVKEAMEAGEKGLKGMEKAVEKVAKEGSKGLEKAVEKARGMVVEQEGEAGVASEAEAAGEGEAEVLEVSRQQDVEAKDDGEKPSASSRMVQPSGPESESVERQDEILEGTEELREEEQREESTVGADVGQENKETEAPGLLGHAVQSETADTPDDDGDEEEEEEEEGGEDEDAGISATAQEDSDAMGQSGSLIDLVKEQASKAADEAAAEKKKRKKNKKKAKGRESEAS